MKNIVESLAAIQSWIRVKRLAESSTWAGIAALLVMFKVPIPGDDPEFLRQVFAGIAGILAIVIPERGSE